MWEAETLLGQGPGVDCRPLLVLRRGQCGGINVSSVTSEEERPILTWRPVTAIKTASSEN